MSNFNDKTTNRYITLKCPFHIAKFLKDEYKSQMTFDFYVRGDNVSKGISQKNCMISISTVHDKYQKTVHKDLFVFFLSS